MSTEWEQDLQEFIDLRARIKELEAALEEWKQRAWRNQAETIRLLNRVGRLKDALEEILDEATGDRDWIIVETAARGVLDDWF